MDIAGCMVLCYGEFRERELLFVAPKCLEYRSSNEKSSSQAGARDELFYNRTLNDPSVCLLYYCTSLRDPSLPRRCACSSIQDDNVIIHSG